MAVKPSSTALDISSEGSPVMPSVRVLSQPKPLQQNRATAEMESAHQLVEELAGPLFQMQAVADGEAHQDGQHHGRHAGCLDDGIDADGDGTEPEQGGQVIFQPAIKPVIDLSLSFVLTVCTFLHGPLQKYTLHPLDAGPLFINHSLQSSSAKTFPPASPLSIRSRRPPVHRR